MRPSATADARLPPPVAARGPAAAPSQRRRCGSWQRRRPPLPSWVLCSSLAEAHALTSIAVDSALRRRRGPPQTLAQVLSVLRALGEQLAASLHVPRDVTDIEDISMFLTEALRAAGGGRADSRFLQLSEEAILDEFEEWVLTGLPPREQLSSSGARGGGADTMPFLQLLSFVRSYVRYHEGVAWGASLDAPGAKNAVAAFHRRAYHLHPWHGVYCPSGWAQQMPYVHLLQWLRDSRGTAQQQQQGALYEQHRALEAFRPPSPDPMQFTALDVCCQSGFGVDLLLKAGAARVVGIDAAAPALGSTEATVREHMKERRSANLGGLAPGGRAQRREVDVRLCSLLPTAPTAAPPAADRAEAAPAATQTTAAAAPMFESAAARRRRLARESGRLYEAVAARRQEPVPAPLAGPYDVLCYHPPVPPLWPLAPLSVRPPAASAWWRLVQAELRQRSGPGVRPLPLLLAPADDAHPHQSLAALDGVVQRLRADASAGRAGAAAPLLRDGGYVACVLPRSYRPAEAAAARGDGECLSDFVVAQLDGLYDVVLRRRHHAAADDVAPLLRAVVGDRGAAAVAEEAAALCGADWWQDVLVLRKRPQVGEAAGAQEPAGRAAATAAPRPPPVAWEDSFEYNEYKPRSAPVTRHHWTDLVPTYSYLEADYFAAEERPQVERNFLSVGHPPELRRAEGAPATDDAAAKYRSTFTEELRQRRRTKVRKMALAPIEQQEWFIDEKLIKSEGAKVEFMNELARWDLKDYDN